MKMRKMLALLLAVLMMAALFAGCTETPAESNAPTDNSDAPASVAPESEEPAAPTHPNQVIMGTTTEPNGFIPVYWGNNATDKSARDLVMGAGTIGYTFEDGNYVINPTVVKNFNSALNEDGSKTFTFEINTGLKWSNGEEITAKDYVGGILTFSHSSVYKDMGAMYATAGYYYAGYEDFLANGDVFSGVRLLGDYEFSVTLDAQYMPHFFEMAYVGNAPEYMAGWLPGYDFADDGEGAYIIGDMSVDAITASIENFYNNMDVFAGPYVLTEYQTDTTTYILDVNPLYSGDHKGNMPSIERIIIKKVAQETQMDELRTGSIDILANVADGDAIKTGLDMADQGLLDFSTYDRIGYGHITFRCATGPTQFKEVRHAIAYLLNRPEFAKSFTAGFGSVVHGPYGAGMQMYMDSVEDLEARLNPYNYSLDSAIATLEAGGWTLNADGSDYSGTGIRYKDVDGTLMPLIIKWASSENNAVSDLIATMLAQSTDVAAAGMQIEQTVMTFAELLYDHYYVVDDMEYSMFNLATGFTPVYNQVKSYEPFNEENVSQYNDTDLHALASDMLKVDPSDYDSFLSIWVDFIDLWNEQLPALPLYSNQYFDFYNPVIENYVIHNHFFDFTSAITDASIAGY